MRFIDQGFCAIACQSRQPDVEPGAEKEAIVPEIQVDFGMDAHIRRKRNLSSASRKRDRTFKAGRPGSGEQLLRIGTDAFRARGRQPDVEKTVRAARDPILTAADGVGLSRVDDLDDLAHGASLLWSA